MAQVTSALEPPASQAVPTKPRPAPPRASSTILPSPTLPLGDPPSPATRFQSTKMDPRSVALIHKIFSAPTTVPGFPSTRYNGVVTTPTRQTTHNYSARIDQHIGDKDFIFFRYSGVKLNTNAPAGSTGSTMPHLFTLTDLPAEQYGVSWMHIFSPSTSMQVQYGRTHVGYNPTTAFDIPNSDLLATYGVDPSFSNFVGGVSQFPQSASPATSPAARTARPPRTSPAFTSTRGRSSTPWAAIRSSGEVDGTRPTSSSISAAAPSPSMEPQPATSPAIPVPPSPPGNPRNPATASPASC